jgi:hypothetical protein
VQVPNVTGGARGAGALRNGAPVAPIWHRLASAAKSALDSGSGSRRHSNAKRTAFNVAFSTACTTRWNDRSAAVIRYGVRAGCSTKRSSARAGTFMPLAELGAEELRVIGHVRIQQLDPAAAKGNEFDQWLHGSERWRHAPTSQAMATGLKSD